MDNLGLSHCYALTMDHEHLNIDYRHARGELKGLQSPWIRQSNIFGQLLNFKQRQQPQKNKYIFLSFKRQKWNFFRPARWSARNPVLTNYWVEWVGRSNLEWNFYQQYVNSFSSLYLVRLDEQFFFGGGGTVKIFLWYRWHSRLEKLASMPMVVSVATNLLHPVLKYFSKYSTSTSYTIWISRY